VGAGEIYGREGGVEVLELEVMRVCAHLEVLEGYEFGG
jgi:hypothetical protein